MSLINKVLQDLDQRHAMTPDGKLPPQQVRAVHGGPAGREWFWRSVAVLIVAALGWVGWVAWQLQPRAPLVTKEALKAAEDAKKKPHTLAAATTAPQAPVVPAQPPAVQTTPPVAPAASLPAASQGDKPAAVAKKATDPAPAIDTLKLAFSIETPIAPRPAETGRKETGPAPARVRPAQAASSSGGAQVAAPSASPRLEKRESQKQPAQRAETEYRRAVAFLNQGRLSDAQNGFAAALDADPSHEAARQAWAALLIEQGHLEDAKKLLVEGLRRNPGQAQFAVVLARIMAGQGDYQGALDALARADESSRGGADYNALRAALLQKLGRHADAAQAYHAVIAQAPESGAAWLGLAISLEALQRRPEAAEAFRHAAESATLTAEVKSYAEQRARALR